MSQISDHVEISALSIPGTHNSMTSVLKDPLYQYQSTGLEQQLQASIRYLDFSAQLKGDSLKIYHPGIDTNIDLSHAFTTAFDFLDKHPHEALVIRIQNENRDSGDDKGDDMAGGKIEIGNIVLSTRWTKIRWNLSKANYESSKRLHITHATVGTDSTIPARTAGGDEGKKTAMNSRLG
ncbi:uncharacterized protein BROUX77_003779 [Berkeleyomyces rouxiae]|uniref:uncharacterized protein n=1 Tax=Berkeleyomyces rouxiae TaxID=2035830 RepID=UPI003B8014A2